MCTPCSHRCSSGQRYGHVVDSGVSGDVPDVEGMISQKIALYNLSTLETLNSSIAEHTIVRPMADVQASERVNTIAVIENISHKADRQNVAPLATPLP